MNYIEVSGTAFEMGFQQGRQLKESINESYDSVIHSSEICYVKPFIIPEKLFINLIKKKATNLMKRVLKGSDQIYIDRLTGIAEGSGVDLKKLFLLQALEIFIDDISYVCNGCSSAGLLCEKSESNEPILIKNFDFLTICAPFSVLRKSNPVKGFQSIDITFSPVIGTHDGMNETGLTILYNYGMSKEPYSKTLPLTILIQKILETVSTTTEAIDILRRRRNFANGAILTLCDASGDIKVVEISPKHFGVRTPVNNFITATNYYIIDELREFNIPTNAYYKTKIPDLKNVRIQQSNESRYNRLNELLEMKEKFNGVELKKILRDHNGTVSGNDDTLCRHSKNIGTTASAIFYPKQRKVEVLFGNPCENEYQEFSIKNGN